MDEDLLAQIVRPCRISRSTYPKIQKVAHHLRNRNHFSQHYSPRMLSLGPIDHYGKPHLKLGEKHKLMWASMYVERDQERAILLRQTIAQNMDVLKNLYDEDATGDFNDQELAQMWFVDSCAPLQILKNPDILDSQPLNAKVDQLVLVRQDALLLENQLPFLLLQLLSHASETDLIKDMDKFLRCHHLLARKPREQHVIDTIVPSNKSPPAHLLDELRIQVVLDGFSPPPQKPTMRKGGTVTHRNLKELKASGIHMKRSKTECPVHITFSSCFLSAELKLPPFVVDDTTAPTYPNLIAYEACPDFDKQYEISSYVGFLDSLIDHKDDVKELRKARVLHNGLGSDKEVAKLFNVIGNDVVPNDAIYASVRGFMESHYQNEYKTWYALAMDTYFSNPWSIIALIAATFILFLTSTQTWFAAFSSH